MGVKTLFVVVVCLFGLLVLEYLSFNSGLHSRQVLYLSAPFCTVCFQGIVS
jgi:hypothetical protein